MSNLNENSFKIHLRGNDKFLIIESDRLEECMRYFYERGDFNGIWINSVLGYKNDNVDFLNAYTDIKHIEINKKLRSLDGIYSLRSLEYLLMDNNDLAIDFRRLPHLKHFRGDWNPKYIGLWSAESLRILFLWKFKPKESNLSALSKLKNLEVLGLTQCRVTSLYGLRELCKLKKLEINYCKSLEIIDEIDLLSQHLEELIFDTCVNLKNHEYAKNVKSLRILRYNNCGKIRSLNFINEMPNLEEFRFVDTTVVDGNLSPLVKLKRVGFIKNSHYSHSPEDFEKKII